MAKLPQVTFGQPTGQSSSPRATLGKASGQGAIRKVPQVVDNELTLGDAITANTAQAPTLTIAELTGPQRRVALMERALPFRGSMKFASEQRIDEGEYTGYPRVNHTVLGGRERDTDMNGAWHDRFLGQDRSKPMATMTSFAQLDSTADSTLDIGFSQSQLRTARDLCDLFEDIAYNGRALRLTWLHLRRIGRLVLFEQDWQNPHDVIWKMSFKWISRDENVDLPSPARTTLVGMSSAFHAAYTDLHQDTNFDDLKSLDPNFADAVDIAVGTIQGAIIDIRDAAETQVGSVSNAADALRRATTLATFARDRAQDLIDTLDAVVYPAMLTATSAGTVTDGSTPGLPALVGLDAGRSGRLVDSYLSSSPGATIAAACQNRAAVRSARAMRHVAARQRFAAIKNLEDNCIGIVRIRDQQDLRDLAADWYGNADDWDQIRKFNGLTTLSPPQGTLVFIPNPGTTS